MNKLFKPILFTLCVFCAFSCKKDNPEPTPNIRGTVVQAANNKAKPSGFYLLNEGKMGANNASLDYMDYYTGAYLKDEYPVSNPSLVMGLGDLGTDVKIYGNKLYVVVNGSDVVEILDAATAKHIASVAVPACRYITFYQNKAYVTSFATPFGATPELGFVAAIDTATFKITGKVTVGYQPEEAAVVGNKLYVANSGGFMKVYDRTVSVIDLTTFKELKKIDVAINLHLLKADSYGDLYIKSRGNYVDIPSKLYVLDTKADTVKTVIDSPIENFTIDNNLLYSYSYDWNIGQAKYMILDVQTEKIKSQSIITDGTTVKTPSGIAVNPSTKEIIITDAGDFLKPGKLYYFTADGKLKWSIAAGINPAHIVFR